MKRVTILFFCFISVNFAQNFQSEEEKKIHEILENTEITLNFTETPFLDAVHFIQLTSGINFIVDYKIIKQDFKVTLYLENVKLKVALDLLCQFYNCAYVFRGNVLFITNLDSDFIRTIVKTYDIRNLCFPSNYILQNKETQTVVRQFKNDSERLKNIITSVIAPDSWKNRASIHIQNGLLIVKNKEYVHRQISLFLKSLGELHDPITYTISLYMIDNYSHEQQDYSSKKLIHQGTVSSTENTVSFVSSKKDALKFSMALLPSVIRNTGIKLSSEITCKYPTGEYRDRGTVLVVNRKESVISILPTPEKHKMLLITAQISSGHLDKEKYSLEKNTTSFDLDRRLQNEKVTADFREAPTFEIANFLKNITGINIIVDSEVYKRNPKCTIKVKKLRLSSFLDLLVTNSYGDDFQSVPMAYNTENGIIVIILQDKLKAKIRSYYVEDLVNHRKNLFVDQREFLPKGVNAKLLEVVSNIEDEEQAKLYRDTIAKISFPEETDVENNLKELLLNGLSLQGFAELYNGNLIVHCDSLQHKNILETIYSLRECLTKSVFIQCSLGEDKKIARRVQNKSLCSIFTKFSDYTMDLKIRPTVREDSTWLEIEYKTSDAQGNIITMVENGKNHVVADINGQQLCVRVNVSYLQDDHRQYLKDLLPELLQKFSAKENTHNIFLVCNELKKVLNHEQFQIILCEQIAPVLTSRLWEEETELQLQILQILHLQNKYSDKHSQQVVSAIKKTVAQSLQKFSAREDTHNIFAICHELKDVLTYEEFKAMLSEQIIPGLTSRLWEEETELQLQILDFLTHNIHICSQQLFSAIKKTMHSSSSKVVSKIVDLLRSYGNLLGSPEISLLFVELLKKEEIRKNVIHALQNILPFHYPKNANWKREALKALMEYDKEWAEKELDRYEKILLIPDNPEENIWGEIETVDEEQ